MKMGWKKYFPSQNARKISLFSSVEKFTLIIDTWYQGFLEI